MGLLEHFDASFESGPILDGDLRSRQVSHHLSIFSYRNFSRSRDIPSDFSQNRDIFPSNFGLDDRFLRDMEVMVSQVDFSLKMAGDDHVLRAYPFAFQFHRRSYSGGLGMGFFSGGRFCCLGGFLEFRHCESIILGGRIPVKRPGYRCFRRFRTFSLINFFKFNTMKNLLGRRNYDDRSNTDTARGSRHHPSSL